MNKYLAEQLLEFNKQHTDQYSENWGTILKFVHKDPDQPGYQLNRNNSGIDFFQKQMKHQEEELLAKFAKKKEEMKKSGITAAHSSSQNKYLKDKGRQINALIKEIRDNPPPSLNLIPVPAMDITTPTHTGQQQIQVNSDPGLPLMLQSTDDPTLAVASIKSEAEYNSMQQVSFQVDLTPTNNAAFNIVPAASQATEQEEHINVGSNNNQRNDQNLKSASLTPNILGSEVLEKINSHLDEMDMTTDSRNRFNDVNLMAMKQGQTFKNSFHNRKYSHQVQKQQRIQVAFTSSQATNHTNTSVVNSNTLSPTTQQTATAMFNKTTNTSATVSNNNQKAPSHHGPADGSPSNGPPSAKTFFSTLRAVNKSREATQQQPHRQHNQQQQQRTVSPFTCSTTFYGGNMHQNISNQNSQINNVEAAEIFSSSDNGYMMVQQKQLNEPVNLRNLHSVNLRSKLHQRLKHFEAKHRSKDLTISNEPLVIDFSGSGEGDHSTHDSIQFDPFAHHQRKQNQHHTLTNSFYKSAAQPYTGSNAKNNYTAVSLQHHYNHFNKSQLQERYGNDELSKNQYIQSMMQIKDQLLSKKGHCASTNLNQRDGVFNSRKNSTAKQKPGGQQQSPQPSASQFLRVQTQMTNDTASFGFTAAAAGKTGLQQHYKGNITDTTSSDQINLQNSKNYLSYDKNRNQDGIYNKMQNNQLKKPSNWFGQKRISLPVGTRSPKQQYYQDQDFIHLNHHKKVNTKCILMKSPFQRPRKSLQPAHTKQSSLDVYQQQVTQSGENFRSHTEMDAATTSGEFHHTNKSHKMFRPNAVTSHYGEVDEDNTVDHEDNLESHIVSIFQDLFDPTLSNMIPVPNQKNAFYASGFNLIDPQYGDLERLYQTNYQMARPIPPKHQDKLYEGYHEGKPDIDRTGYLLKQLKSQTPALDANLGTIKRIRSQAKNKVDYAYKERFCGIYEEKKRQGLLSKDDSWEKFINPAKIGLNNTMQHALNSDYQEQAKAKSGAGIEESAGGTVQNNQQPDKDQNAQQDHQVTKNAAPVKVTFRNALERFHFQFDSEKVQNINESVTYDRIHKANKRFSDLIERAKPSIKLFNLLGYSRSQYIIFRQVQQWMNMHKFSCKKQQDNLDNIKFARENFQIMDDSDSGKLSLTNIAVPMIALGLSSDSSFVMKVLKAISPNKFGKKAVQYLKETNAETQNPFEVNEITLKEFIKIFKKDQVSEDLTEMLCQRIIDRREEAKIKQLREQERRKLRTTSRAGDNRITTANVLVANKPLSPFTSNDDVQHLVDSPDAEDAAASPETAHKKLKPRKSSLGGGVAMAQDELFELAVDEDDDSDGGLLHDEQFQRANTNLTSVAGGGKQGMMTDQPPLQSSEQKNNKAASSFVGSNTMEKNNATAMAATLKSTGGLAEMQQQKQQPINTNDMVAEVRDIWFEIDNGRGMLELNLREVAKLLCKLKILPDVSSAEKYIQNTIQNKTNLLDYDDFNSIFSKGIFKKAMITNRNEVLEQDAKNPNSNPDEKLEFKRMRMKNKILTEEIRRGRIENPDDPVMICKRPILTTLWQLFYKNVPREERESYEDFFNRIQGLTEEIIRDAAIVDLDAFAKDRFPVPPDSAIEVVTHDNVQMSTLPYEAQAAEEELLQQQFAQKAAMRMVQTPVAGTSGTMAGSFRRKSRATPKKIRGSSFKQQSSIVAADNAAAGEITKRSRNDSKSQMSSVTVNVAVKNSGQAPHSRVETAVTQSSYRTANAAANNAVKSSHNSGVKFTVNTTTNELPKNRLDLKLSENPRELMLQRKQRFESLKQMQDVFERTEIQKPPGTDFLEEVYRQQAEEKRQRLEAQGKINKH